MGAQLIRTIKSNWRIPNQFVFSLAVLETDRARKHNLRGCDGKGDGIATDREPGTVEAGWWSPSLSSLSLPGTDAPLRSAGQRVGEESILFKRGGTARQRPRTVTEGSS